jgi:hypothetical protein
MELTKSFFITIDKFHIWQIQCDINDFWDDLKIEYYVGIRELNVNQSTHSDDYIYKIIDKEKFMFAVLKYNIKFKFESPEDVNFYEKHYSE